MKFSDYYKSLDEKGKEDFARRVITTTKYIEIKLLPRRSIPRDELMRALWEQSDGNVSREEVLEHFYPSNADEAA